MPTPTPAPGYSTCAALHRIASNSRLCSTSPDCTHLQCDVLGTSTAITVLPCETPPSISVVTTQGGRVVFSRTFSQSEVVPITSGGVTLLKLNVTVKVSPAQDAMVVEVCGMDWVGVYKLELKMVA